MGLGAGFLRFGLSTGLGWTWRREEKERMLERSWI